MKNGYDGIMAEKFSGMGINRHSQQHDRPHDQFNPSSNNNDSLYQVMKAVEAAEITIQQQVEENNWLSSELQRKIQELEKYNQDESMDHRPHPVAPWNEQGHGSYEFYQSVPSLGNQEDMQKGLSNFFPADLTGILDDAHQKLKHQNEEARSNAENHSVNSKVNGMLGLHPKDQLPADSTGRSQLSSFSTRSISPTRHVIEGDYDPRLNSSGEGLKPVPEMNNSDTLWKKDLSIKIREHEEEIMRLRKHIADYSVKEAQVRNENYVLEKRIAYMRLAFDQQQQDLVDAASKALSYRQDIIEENIHLVYELEDAQQERSAFVQSLLPLLAEYSLQPPALDAQSIVSNVKVLFKHLQETLLLTESKLKESQYQLVPSHSDMSHANFAQQSPLHSIGAALNKYGLELVPQPLYSQVKSPVSIDGQTGTEWDVLGGHQTGLDSSAVKNADPDGLGRFSPLASRTWHSGGRLAMLRRRLDFISWALPLKIQGVFLLAVVLKFLMWHYRLGHPNFKYMQKLYPNLFQNKSGPIHCETCQLAKHTRSTYPT